MPVVVVDQHTGKVVLERPLVLTAVYGVIHFEMGASK